MNVKIRVVPHDINIGGSTHSNNPLSVAIHRTLDLDRQDNVVVNMQEVRIYYANGDARCGKLPKEAGDFLMHCLLAYQKPKPIEFNVKFGSRLSEQELYEHILGN